MKGNKRSVQIVWGVLLIAAGIGVFIRIPQVMPQIAQIEYFSPILSFIRFCFYLIGAMLIGGGAKKLLEYLKKP